MQLAQIERIQIKSRLGGAIKWEMLVVEGEDKNWLASWRLGTELNEEGGLTILGIREVLEYTGLILHF